MVRTATVSRPARKSASSDWKPDPSRHYRWKPRSGANAAKSSTATATTATDKARPYVGRFAPTPSGDLHLGSLYTAVASFLDARAHGGRWLVRIEDLDRPREVAGSADGILRTLEAFGFEWDGEIVCQRDRTRLYVDALQTLEARSLTFQCSCSRLQLEDETRYPGTCRVRPAASSVPTATRLRVEQGSILFRDRIQGSYRQDLAAGSLTDAWAWAIGQWNVEKVPKRLNMRVNG